MHPLLERQLKRFGLDWDASPSSIESWRSLLERVETAYLEADQDRYTLERSLKLSSLEMKQLYSDLERSSAAERDKLQTSVAILQATLESSTEGVLVIDHERHVVNFNRRFLEIWGIPEALASSGDDDQLLDYVMPKLAAPQEFLRRVMELYDHPTETSQDEIALVDGRILERHSAPVLRPDGAAHGRVWFFRDVTPQGQRPPERNTSG